MKFPSFMRLFGERWQQRATRGRRGRARRSSRPANVVRLGLESLEDRTLLATVPPVIVTGFPNVGHLGNPQSNQGNRSSPMLAQDPIDPNKMVLVYVRNDPTTPLQNFNGGTQNIWVEGQFSTNGGATWTTFLQTATRTDPTVTPNPPPLPTADAPSVGFDRGQNFYIVYHEHTANQTQIAGGVAGFVRLFKFDFRATVPVTSISNKLLYAYAGADPVMNLNLTVDNTLPTFSDPSTGQVQTNPHSNNVYVAWNTNQAPPVPTPVQFSPNIIKVMASADGGVNFSTPITASDGGNFPNGALFGFPQLTVSQGTAHNVGTTPTVSEGQLNLVWNNFTPATNVSDTIRFDRVQTGGAGLELVGVGGGITDAVTDANGNTIPGITNFPVLLNVPASFISSITDIDVELSALHPSLGDLTIQLVPPVGAPILLAVGGTNGISGANMGFLNGSLIPTVFDDDAVRLITDTMSAAQAPYTSHFRPLGGLAGLPAVLRALANPLNANGQWVLRFTDGTASNSPPQQLFNWTLRITRSMDFGGDVGVAVVDPINQTNQTPGNYTLPFSTVVAASPSIGLAAVPVIASNNTLGSFSPFQGRIYVAFTGPRRVPAGAPLPPTDATDIFLTFSDNGGQSWSAATRVNADESIIDGFSESNTDPMLGNIVGRPHFSPSIAVDNTTGAVVVTFYDASQDASRVRVARTIAVSNDGGAPGTFDNGLKKSQTFLNVPSGVLDAITGTTVVVGPQPDNFGAANAARDTILGFGTQQALLVHNGKVTAAWSGNRNGLDNGTGRQDILAAQAVLTGGPRIINSTMGPTVPTTVAGFTFNQFTTPDGTPLLDGFVVVFDRRIDRTTFTAGAISVVYHNTVAGSPNIPIPILSTGPVALDADAFGGATTFFIPFDAPQSKVGTYSYAISPVMMDRVRQQTFGISGSLFFPVNTTPGLPIPSVGTGGTQTLPNDVTLAPLVVAGRQADEVIIDVNVRVFLTHANVAQLRLTLIAPDGARVTLLNFGGANGTSIGTAGNPAIFDDQGTGIFPATPLRALNGRNPNGTWFLEVYDNTLGGTGTLSSFSIDFTTQRIFANPTGTGNAGDLDGDGIRGEPAQDRYQVPAPVNVGQAVFAAPFKNDSLPLIISGPRVINSHVPNVYAPPRNELNRVIPPVGTGGTGVPAQDILLSNVTVSGLTGSVTYASVNLTLTHPRVGDLRISLVAPSGLEVLLSNRRGGQGANYTNTSFDDTAASPIGAGAAPFTGRFRPELALAGLNGIAGANLNGVWKLKIEDTALGLSGVLVDWSLTLETTTSQNTTDNLVLNNSARFIDVTFDRDMDPSSFTAADLQRFVGPAGLIGTPRSYSSTDVNKSIPDNVVFQGQPIPLNSNLRISDEYTIGDLNVQISLTHQRLRDLSAFLIGPDGTKIELFASPGQTNDFNLTNTIIDDSGVATLGAGTSPFTGTFRPGRTYQAGLLPAAIPDNNLIGGVPQELVSTLQINDNLTISQLSVRLNISHRNVADLKVVLEAPDGTLVQLFANIGGTGDDYTNTIFDDNATIPIGLGQAPFSGFFRPAQPLSAFANKNINGAWKLHVTDSVTGTVGTLNSWSISATPTNPKLSLFNGMRITGTWQLQLLDTATNSTGTLLAWKLIATPEGMTVTSNPPGTPAGLALRRFRIGFPVQDLSGTYQFSFGPSINASLSGASAGAGMDTNQDAGVAVLRSTPTAGTSPVQTLSSNVPLTLLPGGTLNSTLTFAEDFLIQGATLQLDMTYPNDPDLEATLIAPDGTRIKLFSKVGASAPAGSRQNFSNTIFDDLSQTPIDLGAPPFTGRFAPAESLTAALVGLKRSVGAAPWTLEIRDVVGLTPSGTRRLNSWSLTLNKAITSSGLGEAVSDQATVSFRIFTMDQSNAISSSSWTAIGPGSIDTGVGTKHSGRVSAIAVDPSDPSGNTVYIGAASGGVWKTTNFLTTDPTGPTYIPLTDFGPTSGLNIGSIAIFPRNNDPRQSIIFAATGDGDDLDGPGTISSSNGVGFLRSMDGGATWTLLDSSLNVDAGGNSLPLDSVQRDHIFAFGTTAFKVVVDPRPTPAGDVIVYAAMSGFNGGIYRSTDTGRTWQRMRAGQATDVILDPVSNYIDAVNNPTGNIQNIYGAFRGEGVFFSFNRGQVWNAMLGTAGVPLIQDQISRNPIPVTNLPSPSGGGGKVLLAKPFLTGVYLPDGTYTGNRAQDVLYQTWLYALVINGDGGMNGLFLTKDNGSTWTRLEIPRFRIANFLPSSPDVDIPTNDSAAADYDPYVGGFYTPGNTGFSNGNFHATLAIDPNNPNITYVGGTTGNQITGQNGPTWGMIKVDATTVADAHAFFYGHDKNDGGQLFGTTASPVTLPPPGSPFNPFNPPDADPRNLPTINLLRRPGSPFSQSTLLVTGTATLTNNGTGVKWTPFDGITQGSTNQHELITIRDPLTGKARLILGDDQGIFTGVDNGDVTLDPGTGTAVAATGDRNGNLQITQFYYGAAQPSNLAAQVNSLGALRAAFYGSTLNTGFPVADPFILSNGNLTWNPPAAGAGGGVATDQTGRGTVYQFEWPCCGGDYSNFFRVNGIGRTQFLLQTSNPVPTIDFQWPYSAGFNFAVNPVNNSQVILSSNAGRVFGTSDGGVNWGEIGNPAALDGSNATALAFGAPQPNDPVGALNNFIWAGTINGGIFVTFTGGGANGNQWTRISNGLDFSSVRAIATNPTRGSRDAYAVTDTGVFYLADAGGFAPTWVNITGNLFAVLHTIFDTNSADATPLVERRLQFLSTLTADWRYVIPDNPAVANGPTHPVLYVGGEGGVYRSFDKGRTWSLFPSMAVEESRQEGGYLPNVHVTDLDLALGNIDPTTGRPRLIYPNAIDSAGNPSGQTATGPAVLMASTFGRGAFAIRIAPTIVPNSVALDPLFPAPGGSDTGVSNNDSITNLITPFISGISAQSAFGNTVKIDIFDVTDPTRPGIFLGTGFTNQVGRFSVQINTGANGSQVIYLADGSTDGLKRLAVQATDDQGTVSPFAFFDFELDTTPFVRVQSIMLSTTQPPPVGSDSVQDSSNPTATNTDRITNIALPFIEGTVDQAGPLTVEIFSDATATTLIGSGTTDAAGNYRIQITAGADQINKSIFIRARNATRISNIAQFQFTLDTTAPTSPTLGLTAASDSGQSNTDRNTNVVRPIFQGIGEPNSLIQIFAQPAAGGATILLGKLLANSSGNYQFQVPNAFSDGVYIITATQTDIAGNTSVVRTLAPNLTIDTTPALAPVFDLAAGSDTGISATDHITNRNRPEFSATTPATVPQDVGATVRVFQQRVVGGVPTGTPAQIATGIVQADGTWTAAFTGNTLLDGTYRITAQLIDLAGNIGAIGTMSGIDLVVDTGRPSSPGTPTLLPADDTNIVGDRITFRTQPTFTGTSEANAIIQIFARLLPNGSPVLVGQGNAVGTTYTVQANFPPPATPLADGVYDITAVQIDVAGNASVNSPPLSNLVIDTVVAVPTINLSAASDSGLPAGDHVTNITTPVFLGTGEPGATVSVFIRQGATLIQTLTAVVAASGSYTAAVPAGSPLANGTYSVTAQETDIAGNTSAESAPIGPDLTIDTVPPGGGANGTAPSVPDLLAADDTGVSNTDNITSIRTPRFSGTGALGATVRIFAQLTGGSPVQIGTVAVDGAGNYLVTSATSLADGTYQITAEQFDTAGNVSPRSAALSITIDATLPALPTLVLDPASDTGVLGDNTTASIPQRFNGTAEPGTAVVILDGATTIDQFTQPAGSNVFSRTLNLALGSHPLTVRSTDTAGNVRTSAALNVTIDANALDGDRKYIRSLYTQELGRTGSLAEWNLWLGLLASTNGRATVANGITRSGEARARLVNTWYMAYLGRPAVGNEPWVNSFVSGATEEQVLAQILGSTEFFNRAPTVPGVGGGSPTNQTYVRALYVLFLNRQPGTSEVAFWVGQVASAGRAGVALQILSSVEYRRRVVVDYYTTLLGRPTPPTDGEVNNWVFSGLDITSIRVGFLSSLEYYNRAGR